MDYICAEGAAEQDHEVSRGLVGKVQMTLTTSSKRVEIWDLYKLFPGKVQIHGQNPWELGFACIVYWQSADASNSGNLQSWT